MITKQQAIELKPGDKIKHKEYGVCDVGGVGRYSGGVFAFIRVYIDADVSHSVESLDEDCYLHHNNLPSNDSINDSVWVYLRGTLSVEVSDLSMFDMLEPDEVGFDTGFKTELGNAVRVGDDVVYEAETSLGNIKYAGLVCSTKSRGDNSIKHYIVNQYHQSISLNRHVVIEGLKVVSHPKDKCGRKYKREL